jgi:hypothetical protein
MAKKKLTPPPKSATEKLFDALLGPAEEINDEEAQELITAFGMSTEELAAEFQERLGEASQNIRLQGKDVPETMRNVTKTLREGYKLPAVEPKTWIDNLLSGQLPGAMQVQYSFRKKKDDELTKKDESLLATLKAEVGDKGKS